MRAINRIFIEVFPRDEEKGNHGIMLTHHIYGADNQGTIRQGTVNSIPKGVDWLKVGDTVWFTQRANKQQGLDEEGLAPCVVLEQEVGELWAISKVWAKKTILGVERDGVLSSSPDYIAALPIAKKTESSILKVESFDKEENIRALCYEDKLEFKKGDILHFQKDADYPAKEMESKWVNREGKRVLFIQRKAVFGYERNDKFQNVGRWHIIKSFKEGVRYEKNALGIMLERRDFKEHVGKGTVVYSANDTLKVGDIVKRPEKDFWELYIKGERFYAIANEQTWFKYEEEN